MKRGKEGHPRCRKRQVLVGSSCLPEAEKRAGSWSELSEGSMVPAGVGEEARREGQVTISLPCLEFSVTLDTQRPGPVDGSKWVK